MITRIFGLLLLAGILVSSALWSIWPFVWAFVFVYGMSVLLTRKGEHDRRKN